MYRLPRRAPINSYYSRTQFFLVNGPFVWSLVAVGVTQLYFQRPPLPVAMSLSFVFFVLSVLWLFIGRRLTNSAYETGTPRFLCIDISKNLQPSRA